MATYGSTSETEVLEISGSAIEEIGYTNPQMVDASRDVESTDISTPVESDENVTVETVMTDAGRRYKVTRTAYAAELTESVKLLTKNSTDVGQTEDTPLNSAFPTNITDHCHVRDADGPKVDKRARCKLITASILCLLFMIAEIVGGVLSSSLALATDAAHLLTDFASFMISLFALYIASRPATRGMNFGWHRAEVMGALISVLLIWVVTGVLLYMAVERVISGDYEIQGAIMLITAGLGVAFNIIMLATLHDHGHSHGGMGHGHSHGSDHHDDDKQASTTNDHSDTSKSYQHHNATSSDTDLEKSKKKEDSNSKRGTNINVRAAFIHVLGDLIQSFGVLIAALLVYFKPEYKLADPICTFIFSVLVLFTTINILRDTLNVLMEGTPRGLSFEMVKECLATIPGVLELHNLRIWSLTVNRTAVAVHLAVAPDADHQEISRQAGALLRQRFSVYEFTIQTEQFVEDMKDCKQCANP